MSANCTDCGCALAVHDAGWCYGACTISHQCRHEPQVFKVVTDTARKPRVVVAYGTRPEKIKLESVVAALRAEGAEVVEWFSGQQRDLVDSGFKAALWDNGIITGIAETMSAMRAHLKEDEAAGTLPSCVIVQGDTATAFACAQAAFLVRVPVAHVEAGLRTYASEPWPEEAFRRQIAAVARWHFCPDQDAANNVGRELGMGERSGRSGAALGISIVGNTVIDTLPKTPFRVLVTLHRRENWGARRQRAIEELARFTNQDGVETVLIRHPNWRTPGAEVGKVEPAERAGWWHVLDPMPHDDFLRELQRADLLVTDSGGLQEEAAHFGTPTLVLRTATERVSLERLGAIDLVHPDEPRALYEALEAQLARRRAYGSGDAGARIAQILFSELDVNP